MRRTQRSRRLRIGLALSVLVGSVAVAAPAQATTGSVMVAVSDGAGLQVAVQQDGNNPWTIQPVSDSAGWSWSSPSMVKQAGSGDVEMTAIRGDGSLWFWWQAPSQTIWNAMEVAGPNSAYFYSQPSIVAESTAVGGTAYTMIVAQDQNDQGATFYENAFLTNTWSNKPLPTLTGLAVQPDIALTANETAVVSYIATEVGGYADIGIDEMLDGGSSWTEGGLHTDIQDGILDASVIVQPNTGNLLVAAANSEGDLYFFYSPIVTSWYQESIASGTTIPTDGTYDQPLAITGNEQGVAEGLLNSAGTCAYSIDQANGPNKWLTQKIDCPGGYPTVPVIEDQPGTYNEVAAFVVGDGGAYFAWEQDGTTNWITETIHGISDVEYYTQPAVISV